MRPYAKLANPGFLSTLSLRRATPRGSNHGQQCPISIHALLAESDTDTTSAKMPQWDFYPRSPCGERLYNLIAGSKAKSISIHALLAESDSAYVRVTQRQRISIHALLAESDDFRTLRVYYRSHFYPRSPCGERLIS